MSALLAEHSEAAFADRAPHGKGLRATLADGVGGCALCVTRPANISAFFTRVMVRVSELQSGAVTLMRGSDESAATTFTLRYSAVSNTITLLLGTGESVESSPLTGLAWHCVELQIDIGSGGASMWIDGLREGQLTLTTEAMLPLITRRFELGVMDKTSDAAGTIDMDEWVIAGQPIGPVIVRPTQEHAADPARWIALFNRSDADSVVLAQSYRVVRGLPWANLLGLDLPSDETITPEQYASLAQAVNDYVEQWFPVGQILGIVTLSGVPGFVNFSGTIEPVPALLQSNSTSGGEIENALATGDLHRPTASNMAALRMTARIDGPTLARAQFLLDRATLLESQRLGSGDEAAIFISLDAPDTEANTPAKDALIAWASSLDRMKTRLPMRLSTDQAGDDGRFTRVEADGFFWGLVSADAGPELFPSPGGARAICVPLNLNAATCTTLRDASSSQWISKALAAGYAAAIGASRVADPVHLPDCNRFFEALRLGWTVAEAWMVASPMLRQRSFLVGDPLLSLALPRSGWELFGPINHLHDLDPSTPAAILRDAQHSLDVTALLQERDSAGLAVRRTDEHGVESDIALVRWPSLDVSGESQRGAHLPLWPCEPGWPVVAINDRLHARAVWELPLRSIGIEEVQLIRWRDGEMDVMVSERPASRSRIVRVELDCPAEPVRLAWRIWTSSTAWVQTPWSAPTPRFSTRSLALTELEEYR